MSELEALTLAECGHTQSFNGLEWSNRNRSHSFRNFPHVYNSVELSKHETIHRNDQVNQMISSKNLELPRRVTAFICD